jgi:hypothetical protein
MIPDNLLLSHFYAHLYYVFYYFFMFVFAHSIHSTCSEYPPDPNRGFDIGPLVLLVEYRRNLETCPLPFPSANGNLSSVKVELFTIGQMGTSFIERVIYVFFLCLLLCFCIVLINSVLMLE